MGPMARTQKPNMWVTVESHKMLFWKSSNLGKTIINHPQFHHRYDGYPSQMGG